MASSSEESKSFTLHVRMSTGARFSIGGPGSSLTPSSSVAEVKQCIAEHDGSDRCPVDRQRLIFRGRILSENSHTLEQYGVTENDAVLHLVKGSASVVPTTAATTGSSTTASSSNSSSTTTSTPRTTTAAPSFTATANPNPFGNLFHQDPATMMADMQNNPMMQQMMSDPAFMQNMMNSPLFQNPDMLLNLMQANPQMRQLMDSNPQLRHVLSDPQILQQTMQAMRDPSHMATMMRNQDLAMSQIENYPGGFNALRRMYEEVQEPMMDAMSNGPTTPTTLSPAAPTSSSSQGTAGVAMPNPWGSGPTTRSTPTTQSLTTSSNTSTPSFGWPNLPTTSSTGAFGAAGGVQPPPPELMEQTLAMLENPQLRDAMTSALLENPQMMQQMMDMNPQMRQLRNENPELAQVMSNPEFLRTMMDPNVMRSMMSLQQSMQQQQQGNPNNMWHSLLNLQQALGPTTMFPSDTRIPSGVPAAPGGGLDFSSLLQQTQNMNLLPQQHSTSQQQQQQQRRYDHLVTQLVDMGFDNRESNLRALQATGGNINRAVDYLLENPTSNTTVNNSSDGTNESSTGGQ